MRKFADVFDEGTLNNVIIEAFISYIYYGLREYLTPTWAEDCTDIVLTRIR